MVKKSFLFIVTALLFITCYIDVPHDSRFDTLNPFGKSSIYIEVSDKNNMPVESAAVTLNDTLVFYSDENGIFSMGTFIQGALSVKVKKENYGIFYTDTLIKTGIPFALNIKLNYIPVIEEFKAYSSVKRVVSFDDTTDYNANYTGIITDKDGISDIDSCIMTISSMRFPMNVFEKNGAVICSLTFNEDNEFFSIYDMQGETAFMEVYDKSNEVTVSGLSGIVRFIENTPAIIFPVEGGTVNLPDTLRWSPSEETFESYFRIGIFKDSFVVFSVDSIKPSDSTYVLDTLFSEGSYRMNLKLLDAFGNYSENSVLFSIF